MHHDHCSAIMTRMTRRSGTQAASCLGLAAVPDTSRGGRIIIVELSQTGPASMPPAGRAARPNSESWACGPASIRVIGIIKPQ
jgi:hypothetical protein